MTPLKSKHNMNSIWSTDTNCSIFENNIFSKLTLNEGTYWNNISSVAVVCEVRCMI